MGALWSAGALWRPVPVYQTHMAYTSHLDGRNADALAAPGSADVILREDFGLDGTNPLWQSPRLQVEYLCRFSESVSDDRWRVLIRSKDRCEDPRPLGTVEVDAATPTHVPSAEGIVVADIDAIHQPQGQAGSPVRRQALPGDAGTAFRAADHAHPSSTWMVAADPPELL